MTTFWVSVFGALVTIVGILAGWLGHKVGTKDKAQEVALAKELTEQTTRAKVADETAAAAAQATTAATASRQDSDVSAHATAAQGDDVLNAALKNQGMLRD